MRYDEILLTIEKEEARKRITERVSGFRTNTTEDRIEYRTNAGYLLAILSDAELPSGETGSKLRYRTVIIGSPHIHARAMAQQIRRAVADYKVE